MKVLATDKNNRKLKMKRFKLPNETVSGNDMILGDFELKDLDKTEKNNYSIVTVEGKELVVFDIFRIENGKIVEHWDNIEPIPLRF